MTKVTRQQALNILNSIINGQIFTVVFVKRGNGELREMNCRKGVKAHQSGGSLAYSPNEHNLIPVFDMKANGYRMIPYEGIKVVRYGGGKEVKVVN
tara:strand:+ start:40109 stop:40396 length:288 start_codon:yes stop_codon:yes gene_type:complete